MCIRAAQVGCGVALLPRFLVEEELADGKLVIPWQHAMPSTDAYYLAYPEHSAEVPKVRDFVKWMLEQVDSPALAHAWEQLAVTNNQPFRWQHIASKLTPQDPAVICAILALMCHCHRWRTPVMSESVFADRIVQNLLDTDFYKLTMMQAVLHNYPNVEVEWEFRCRNSEDLRPYLAEIRFQIERLAELSLSADQLSFLERISFLKPDFLRFLGLFRFNLRYVHTGIENGELFIRLRGPWLHVILFEVPIAGDRQRGA